VSLFETLWQIHSGEIFGLPGKLFVDLLGLITFFLSITGLIYFFFPKWIKRRKKLQRSAGSLISANRWSLKWHNLTGNYLFVALIILFFSGMFLRPPLLIAIARSNVPPLKFSHLDQPNPWYDKLRDIHFEAETGRFLLATSEGMFHFTSGNTRPESFEMQPPVSVMGINVFQPYAGGAYLIGSFSGLFLWHPSQNVIYDFAMGKPYLGSATGRPVGMVKASGLVTNNRGERFLMEYDRGALPLWHQTAFPAMPVSMVAASTMSLWNVSLEIHTGRIFSSLIGNFYILLVPLSAIVAMLVTLSGYMIYRRGRKVRPGIRR